MATNNITKLKLLSYYSFYVLIMLSIVSCKKEQVEALPQITKVNEGSYKVESYTMTFDDGEVRIRKPMYWYRSKNTPDYPNGFVYEKAEETQYTVTFDSDNKYSSLIKLVGQQFDDNTQNWIPFNKDLIEEHQYSLVDESMFIGFYFEGYEIFADYKVINIDGNKVTLYGETVNSSGYKQRHRVTLVKN